MEKTGTVVGVGIGRRIVDIRVSEPSVRAIVRITAEGDSARKTIDLHIVGAQSPSLRCL